MTLSIWCLESLRDALEDTLELFPHNIKAEKSGDFDCYWTNYGILIYHEGKPKYFFHNNRTVFLFKRDTINKALKVGLLSGGDADCWPLSFLEALQGILVRSLMTDATAPKCTKLLSLAEDRLVEVEHYKEDNTKWLIS